MEVWERQPYDTDASFNAFHRYYLSQEPPRSVDEAYRRWKKGPTRDKKGAKVRATTAWQEWAQGRKFNNALRKYQDIEGALPWRQRAQAFDDHLAALQRAEWERRHMSDAEVLARLADHARGNMGDLSDVKTFEDLKDHPQAHLVKKLVSRINEDSDGKINRSFSIELHDAQSALVHLGRHHGLFADRIEHSGEIGGLVILPAKDEYPADTE